MEITSGAKKSVSAANQRVYLSLNNASDVVSNEGPLWVLLCDEACRDNGASDALSCGGQGSPVGGVDVVGGAGPSLAHGCSRRRHWLDQRLNRHVLSYQLKYE